jgi:hypothetical protein
MEEILSLNLISSLSMSWFSLVFGKLVIKKKVFIENE